jgi:hypothetical protein
VGVIHVTFGDSAAGCLLQALGVLEPDKHKSEIRASVRQLIDDLSVGPIAADRQRQRATWRRNVLWFEREQSTHVTSFWRFVTTTRDELVVWMSRRSAREYCGLLALCARVDQTRISVVDVASLDASGFGAVAPRTVVTERLLTKARRLSALQHRTYRKAWQRLQRENACVRVVAGRRVVSQPATYLDAALLSSVTDDWQSSMRVVGLTMTQLDDSSDLFLWERIAALVDDGVIEGRTPAHWRERRELEVRRLSGSSGSRGRRRGGADPASAT